MTEPRRFFRPPSVMIQVGTGFFGAALLLTTGLSGTSQALAQAEPVTVDLSVIDDGGVTALGAASGRKLLIPPRTNPVSELHVAPKNAPQFRAPIRQVQKPAPAKAATPAASAVPVETAMSQSAAPAAPAPQPAPVAEVAKTEVAPPPAPVALTKSEPAPATAPAGEPMAASGAETTPPPPPPPAVKSDAPPPPPQVAAAAEPAAPVEQASTGAQALALTPGQALRIEFAEAETKLPDDMKDTLRKIADGIHDKQDLRLQLMAYAGAEGLSASKARRLSLSRALSVRSFLIESGVRSTRIDVRALGNKTSEAPANRVDVNVAKR